jgi:hypothetical protein
VSQIGFPTSMNFPGVFIIFYIFFLTRKNAFEFIFESEKSDMWRPLVGLSGAARRTRIGHHGWLPPFAMRADIKEGRVRTRGVDRTLSEDR